jgi:alpha-galactosidase
MTYRNTVLAACMLACTAFLPAQSNLSATPPMGWNSWNHFAEHVTDKDVRSAADLLVGTGMRDAGYLYVNVDDTWQGKRDANGVLHPNSRFPDMKALGEYIHSRGLKFGIYSSPGAKTCGGYEGSLGHEAQDARMYASWGVDYLKYDLCSLQDPMRAMVERDHGDPTAAYRLMIDAFRTMGDALRATHRPIVYSLCQYGIDEVWKWGPTVGAQLWRTTDDIDDTFDRMTIIGMEQAGLASYAGAGHWNDPDMLEIGNGRMSAEEYRAHMSRWVLVAAPLLAGNDLSSMTEQDKSILLNREAIAIDQDPLGRQGELLFQHGDSSVWTKPLAGNRVAVGMFNTAGDSREVSFDLGSIGFGHGALLHDVWQHRDLGAYSGLYSRNVAKHGVVLLIVSARTHT